MNLLLILACIRIFEPDNWTDIEGSAIRGHIKSKISKDRILFLNKDLLNRWNKL
ncbi:hypothetical protein [Borreliella valaisiana]|uniref:hypothetical protein n=1 Tax=Borreliella valaisiana TaxID=62088 RepID=UPI003BA1D9A5